MNTEKKQLTVFSGEVKMAECGELTPYFDMAGKQLRTGDIVVTFTELYVPDELTVVVKNQGNSWEAEFPDFYVMGIASVPLNEDGEWKVRKLKDHSDVIEGESWTAYGFNYKQA